MYTTKVQIQNYLQINIADSFDTQIDEWITAIDKYIDKYCHRTFEQESGTTKLYDGDGTEELLVDNILTVSKIEILDEDGNVDETLSSSNFHLYPANSTPKTIIKLNHYNSSIGYFPDRCQNIRVTGTFGYSATVPEDIRLVATKLVAGIIQERNLDTTGEIKSESLGAYSVTFQDLDKMAGHLGVFDILKQYKEYSI